MSMSMSSRGGPSGSGAEVGVVRGGGSEAGGVGGRGAVVRGEMEVGFGAERESGRGTRGGVLLAVGRSDGALVLLWAACGTPCLPGVPFLVVRSVPSGTPWTSVLWCRLRGRLIRVGPRGVSPGLWGAGVAGVGGRGVCGPR
jgi:hypothetical protein